MISLCTVIIDSVTPFLKTYKDWVTTKTKLIKEVCFCKVDAAPDFYHEETINNITFKTFGTELYNCSMNPGNQHALGMHACIDRAAQPYIFLCDPDIFFYTYVDEIYFNLMQEHKLDIIGASHHASTKIAQGFFPWHGNLLVLKDKLPTQDWLKGALPIDGKYLLMNIQERRELFPSKNKNFDTGSHLWLWGHEQKWRWLAFQTLDCHIYTTIHYKNNIKLRINFKKQKLLYHAVSGSIKPSEVFDTFEKKYIEVLDNSG
jgi:hypothetical protein